MEVGHYDHYEVGDWVVRTPKYLVDNWIHGTKPMRVKSQGGSGMDLVGDDSGMGTHWRASRKGSPFFRDATPEEIAARPIEVGDIAHSRIGAWCGRWPGASCQGVLDHYRHATPEEYRAYMAEQTGGPVPVLEAAGPISAGALVALDSEGRVVDDALEQSDFGEEVALDPEKVEATLAELRRDVDLAREAGGINTRCLGWATEGRAELERRLEALEAAVQCDYCRKYEHECICEAEPPAPEGLLLPPLLWDRVTGKGPYVRVHVDDDGEGNRDADPDDREFYYSGEWDDGEADWDGETARAQGQCAVALWPQTLTTTPPSPPEPPADVLASLRERANEAEWQATIRGRVEGRRIEREVTLGRRLLWTLFVAVVSLLVGWLGACAFGALGGAL